MQIVYCRHTQIVPAQAMLGTMLWAIGLIIDIWSDLILQNLRRKNPQKGLRLAIAHTELTMPVDVTNCSELHVSVLETKVGAYMLADNPM